jgi:hypothetical protein
MVSISAGRPVRGRVREGTEPRPLPYARTCLGPRVPKASGRKESWNPTLAHGTRESGAAGRDLRGDGRLSLRGIATGQCLVSRRLDNQVIDDAVCFVDVLQGAMPQPMRELIIFFFGNIMMRAVEQFEGLMIASSAAAVHVYWHVVGQVFAIIDGGAFDFADGGVDFADSMCFLVVEPVRRGQTVEMGARVAKIGKRVQVGRMPSRLIGEGQGGADRQE